jgi:uncharacterized protein (TIGR04255 family)
MKEIPIAIDPCPIVEAVVELRFDHNINSDAVFGIFYSKLNDRYPVANALDIKKKFSPEVIKKAPEFKYKPHHQLRSQNPESNIRVNIGPNVISIVSKGKYLGWKKYSEDIHFVLKKMQKINFIEDFVRLGIRYMNFFEGDILENTELEINLEGQHLNSSWTQIIYEYNLDQYKNRINVWNNSIAERNNQNVYGTLIDIDTVYNKLFGKGDVIKIIEKGHDIEKKLFYSLLKKEFVDNTLHPVYK